MSMAAGDGLRHEAPADRTAGPCNEHAQLLLLSLDGFEVKTRQATAL
jgi:hypothetical protein